VLREVQLAFVESMLAGSSDAAAFIRGGKLTPDERLAIYRHNVLSNLRGALQDIFPVVRRVVGDAFFKHAADQFIGITPSRSGDLNRFGAEWPLFLADYPHAKELPYLADVARLEWSWHESFHAADAGSLDLGCLAAVPAASHEHLRFRLQPALRLVASPYPILQIWQVNQPGFTGSLEIDWEQPGDSLVIHRQGSEVVIRSLPAAGFRFLSALSCGARFEPAAAASLGEEAEFDLQGFLIESVQSGIIVDFDED
jgi:hypothetical protein